MRLEIDLDGNQHKSARILTPAKQKTRKPNNPKTNKKITKRKTKSVSITLQIKEQEKIFVGIDLYKTFIQVSIINNNGELLRNRRVENDVKSIKSEFLDYPKDAKFVIEFSSVRYGTYRYLTDSLNLDVY